MSPPLILGVVLYRNPERELARLVGSLELARSQPGTARDFTVRWLDNSPDASLQPVLERLLPGARYAHAGENLGFGAAQNRLMAEAFRDGARHYVCLNPDALLHPGCLQALVDEAERAGARAGLVEARTFPEEHAKPYDPVTHDTDWCSGCVLLVTRPLYEASGGFDPRFFMYCEDVDLSWRARALGFTVRIAPDALAHHYTLQRETSARRELSVRRSGALLAAKYGNARFLRTCVREYHALGGSEPLAPPLEHPPQALARAASFDHLFDFARLRW
jgi:hypothetical protein